MMFEVLKGDGLKREGLTTEVIGGEGFTSERLGNLYTITTGTIHPTKGNRYFSNPKKQ